MKTPPRVGQGVSAKEARRAEKQTQALEQGRGIPFFAGQIAKKLVTFSKKKRP